MATTKNAARKASSKALKAHVMDIKTVPVPTKREVRLLKAFRKMGGDNKRYMEFVSDALANPRPHEPAAAEEPKVPDYNAMSHEELRKLHHSVDLNVVLSPERAREYVRGLLHELLNVNHNTIIYQGLLRAYLDESLPDQVMNEDADALFIDAINNENDRLANVTIALEDMLGVQWNRDYDAATSFMSSTPPKKVDESAEGKAACVNPLLVYDIADGLNTMSNGGNVPSSKLADYFRLATTAINADAAAGGNEASYTKERRRKVREALGAEDHVRVGDGKE